jgi:hypothetical protein
MGRPKGFVLSDEQKAKMQAGRKNKKLNAPKPIKIVTSGHKGRPKGTKRSQEEIDKARITRKANIEKRSKEKIIGKPVLKISRKWKNGFDFWPAMRNILRPLHRNLECKKIEKEIVNPKIWEDRDEVIKILENYFILENKKVKDSI